MRWKITISPTRTLLLTGHWHQARQAAAIELSLLGIRKGLVEIGKSLIPINESESRAL